MGLMVTPAFPPTPLDLLSEDTTAPCPVEGLIWKKSPEPLLPEIPALIELMPGNVTDAPPSCAMDSMEMLTFLPLSSCRSMSASVWRIETATTRYSSSNRFPPPRDGIPRNTPQPRTISRQMLSSRHFADGLADSPLL